MNKLPKKPRNENMYKAILTLRDVDECMRFFDDLCTVSELMAMEQRYQVASCLNDGMIYNDILAETGAEKVNIIAHSKGGLEARVLASGLGMGDKIASITTVGTPHRGSRVIDRLLEAPRPLFSLAALAVNNWIRLVGDKKPDFLAVCQGFSTAAMEDFNKKHPDYAGVFYQSYACVMAAPWSDFNLGTANLVIQCLEGDNDGLVSVSSAQWGQVSHVLHGPGGRGISHLDEVDFRRRPFKKRGQGILDICQVYVEMVQELKARGL